MFALKPWKEFATRALLSAVILFNALAPIGVSAQSLSGDEQITNSIANSDIANSITLGTSDITGDEQVPILSEQIAQQAQQSQEEKPVFQVDVDPAIYMPGKPIQINWKVQNTKSEALTLNNAEVVIHTPTGLATMDVNQAFTEDGLLTVPLQSKNQSTALSVSKGAEFPMFIDVDLLVNDDLIATQTVMIDQPRFQVNKSRGGNLKSVDGKVEVNVPANAISESLLMDIREPAPHTLPGVSLTGRPLEIIAVGQTSQKNIHQFKAPLKIKLTYDEKQIFDWDENSLTIFYYDPDLLDWFPIETTVDPVNNTLTAYSDHLTVFDYKANNWQSQMVPTVDAFKTAEFTGAGTYQLNLWVPPAPGGLQPNLALSYNSQVIDGSSAFSQSSWVGMGWDLDTGSVTRNMHGTDTDNGSVFDDTFMISAGGVSGALYPIATAGETTTFNTADQSFMKVIGDNAAYSFTAWTKDGTKYEFIDHTDTNLSDGCATPEDQNGTPTTWRWSLSRVTDVHGNQINYTYYTEKKPGCLNEVAVYPDTITYGNYQVKFIRETRNDYQTSWTTTPYRTLYGTQRLKMVQILNNGVIIKHYDFSYAPNNSTNIYPNHTFSSGGKTLTLVGVQEFGSDGAWLPSVQFTYGDSMHLTDVNNGQGGLVHMNYERWSYYDDVNPDLHTLKTNFGTGGNECYDSNHNAVSWTRYSGTGVVRCDLSTGYMQIGGKSTTPTQAIAEHTIPEHLTKPGAAYRYYVQARSISGTRSFNWGIRDGGTLQSLPAQSVGTTATVFTQTLDMPVTFNPVNTRLQLDCNYCYFKDIQFSQWPMAYRVTSRTVNIQPTGTSSTYTYGYDNASPNSADNSAAAAYGNAALYTKLLLDFRGHAMTQVVNSEGLATVNWFHQTDALKGRAYDKLVMKQDFYDPLNATSTNWVNSGGTLTFAQIAQKHFDNAAQLTNSGSGEVSFARTSASLTSGEMAVAHVRLSGSSATGKVELVNGSQLLGINLQSNSATASNNAPLLSAGNFIKDKWYGVMIIVDAVHGSRVRIWQLDNPANFGETVVSGIGGGSWTFRDRVYNGTLSLDSYFEGVPYTETITRYDTTVQYDTIINNGIPDMPGSGAFPDKDLQIVWNTVASVEQRNYNGDASFVGTKQVFTYAPASQYGNLLTQTDYENNNGTLSAYRGTKYEYYPNSTAYILGAPARQVTLDCQSGTCDFTNLTSKKAETYYFYDNATAYTALPTKGDLTRQRTWIKDDQYSQTSFTYYANGNQKDQVVYTGYTTTAQPGDPAGPQITTTTYDTDGYGTYPVLVTNALGQQTHTTYNYNFGVPNSVTSPNGSVTSATYDGFGRLKTITAPGDGSPTLQVAYYDNRIPFQVDLTQTVDASASIRLSRFYDGAGQQIQTQTVGAVVNGVPKNIVTDYQYNNLGRLVKQSVPNMINYTATPGFATQNFTTSTITTYDVLGRPLSVTPPNQNAASYVYGDLTTTVTDPKLIATTSTMDVWGRTIQVDAPEGPDIIYTYDLLNRLKTALRGGKTTTINYDAAGRKLNMDDPDMGFWQYKYDALGNLTLQTDARGCALTLEYDALSRLTHKSSAEAGCSQPVNNHYYYDSDDPATPEYDAPAETDQKGYRTYMTDSSGSTSWQYDLRGRLSTENKTIDTQTYTTGWTYNSADLPATMTYPDNEVLTYGYNSDGTLKTVTSSQGGVYLNDMQYDEAGRLKLVQYGAGVLNKTFTYFPWNTPTNGGLLQSANVPNLQSLSYTYDKNANVETITDSLAGPQTQTFAYDSLNRLISAQVTGGTDGLYSEMYEYNATTGNLSLKDNVSYMYDPNHAHAVASLSNGNSYAYDANGNMTQRLVNGQTFDLAYDAESKLVGVTGQGVQGLSTDMDLAPQQDVLKLDETLPMPVVSSPTATPTVSAPTATPAQEFAIQTVTPTANTSPLFDAEDSDAQREADVQDDAVAALTSVSYYVNIATGNNSNACTSPLAPCKNLQETITKAASGDVIYVASGRYLFSANGSPNVVIINGKNLTLSGGWNADFSSQSGASTIDGANANNGILIVSGTVVVENFIVENSTSWNSGAIYMVNGNLTLRRSTLRNNVASNNGAGIFIDNGSANIINSTISGNRAGAGGGGVYASLNSAASVTIQSSTIVYNQAATGGGISRANGTYTITNTIVANNTGTTASPDCSGTIATANFNVIENTAGCTITSGGNNLITDPQISSTLSGTMLVHLPLAGSPVINAGTTTGCPATDQQGTTRPQGSSCEIGSVEMAEVIPQLGLQVTASPDSYTAAGQIVQYTYTLTNTGNVPLTAPYSVSDNKVASVNCSAAVSPLAAGASTTCTGSYTITEADVTAGSVTNSASASASYSTQTITSSIVTATIRAPRLSLQINPNPRSFTAAGEVINYTYTLTNTGSVSLNGPYVVTDSKVASVDCSAAVSPLPVGSNTTCTGSYTVTEADVTASSITSSASATASDGLHSVVSNAATARVTLSTGTADLSVLFTYDGDGKRVKSVTQTNSVMSTTQFVGSYYEVTGSTVTKYYYAGTLRIAMSKGGTLSFLLGDHLGSTSLMTDSTGTLISELRYTAWGEVRYTFGAPATGYTYTGQYSYTADFGLMYYNARWYDPSLGRFAQADTIVPGGVQGYDRYVYTNNNPIKYTDPSGHCIDRASGNVLTGYPWGTSGLCPSTTNTPPTPTAPTLPSGTPLDPATQNVTIYGEDNRKNEFLNAVLRHQNELPPGMSVQLLLAMGSAECGYDNGWDQFCSITGGGMSADGILQLSVFGNATWHHKSGSYENTPAGFDNNVRDAIGFLNEISATWRREGIEARFTNIPSGTTVKLLLYYNGGPNPVDMYASGKGNQQYLTKVAEYLENSPFGPQFANSQLASDLREAQKLLDARVKEYIETGK